MAVFRARNERVECGYPCARALECLGLKGGQTSERNTITIDGAGGIGPMWGAHGLAQLNLISRSGLLITDNQGIGGGKKGKHHDQIFGTREGDDIVYVVERDGEKSFIRR